MRENWLNIFQSFLEKVLISLSYRVVTEIKAFLNKNVPLLSFSNSFSVYILFYMGICIVMFSSWFKNSKTLITIFSIISADTMSMHIPFPKEPINLLFLPSIYLYIGLISTWIWSFRIYLSYLRKYDVIEESISNFLILYIVSRIIMLFEKYDVLELLGILSLIYLLLPIHAGMYSHLQLQHIFVKIIETLSVRGIVLWLNLIYLNAIGVFDMLALIIAPYILLVFNPFQKSTKLANCSEMLAFSCAQKLSSFMHVYLSNMTALFVFSTSFTVLVYLRMCPHLMCKIARMGANFSFISFVDKEIKSFTIFEEKIILFIVILVVVDLVLEHLRKTIKVSETTTTQQVKKSESIITIISGTENASNVQLNVGLPSTSNE